MYTLLAQDEDGSVALPGGSGQTTVFNNSDVNITGVAVLENGASSVTSSFNIASQDWGMGLFLSNQLLLEEETQLIFAFTPPSNMYPVIL